MAPAAASGIETRAEACPVFVCYFPGNGIDLLKSRQGRVEEVLIVGAHTAQRTSRPRRATTDARVKRVISSCGAAVAAIALAAAIVSLLRESHRRACN